jgi:hypothetical protein
MVGGATASAVAAGVIASKTLGSRLPWFSSSMYNPWQPTSAGLSARGLIRDDFVYDTSGTDEEELTLRAKLPSSPHGFLLLLVKGLTENASNLARLLSRLPQAISSEALPHQDSNDMAVDEFRVLLDEFVLLMGLAVNIMGASLVILLPMLLLVHCMSNQSLRIPALPLFSRVIEAMDLVLMPLDCFFSPLLQSTAKRLGILDEELFGEESAIQEWNRLKRVLLGLLVLNVAASIVTLVLLAIFVAMIRCVGILN